MPIVTCLHCQSAFNKPAYETTRSNSHFCSLKCKGIHSRKKVERPCAQCGTLVARKLSQCRSKENRLFCSKSCAGTYNNLHKVHGTRRSKLEVWLEEQLRLKFPTLPIQFNEKLTIQSELDILFPTIQLAVELNGIFHYEPIHGIDKLTKIQNNDSRKFQACLERGIELIIIDTSGMKYFKPNAAEKYLRIITEIVKKKVGESNP